MHIVDTPVARLASGLVVLCVLAAPFTVHAGDQGSSSATGADDGGSSPTKIPAAVASGWWRHYPFYVTTITPSGQVVSYLPPQFIGYGAPPVVVLPVALPLPTFDPGPVAPAPPVGRGRPVRRVRHADPDQVERTLTLGDRMFRVADWKRAEDRYEQAARLDPASAAPRARLAQIAIVRGRYREAADRFREAETVQPGWLTTARDVQALYSEPADFAEAVSRIESHLRDHPDDRDARLALGAQWFLSGRHDQAVEVLRRLEDPNRRPDPVLAAFLTAASQRRAGGFRYGAPPGVVVAPVRPPADRR